MLTHTLGLPPLGTGWKISRLSPDQFLLLDVVDGRAEFCTLIDCVERTQRSTSSFIRPDGPRVFDA